VRATEHSELAAVLEAQRLVQEIKTTAQHLYILPLFDSGEADSFLFGGGREPADQRLTFEGSGDR
jgi:hypothetical protein